MKKQILLTLFALSTTFGISGQQPQLDVQVQAMPQSKNYDNNGHLGNQPGKPGNYQMNSQNTSDNYWSGSIEGLDNPALTTKGQAERPQMAAQQTLSIIKPDAVKNHHIGDIVARFEKAGLRIAAMKMTQLTKDQAGKFYQVHSSRPFYPALVEFMTSGPVVIMVLEGDNAITKNREIMGATDPSKAGKGTLRADFAESVTRNAVHGSDSPETAKEEINFFFKPNEVFTQ